MKNDDFRSPFGVTIIAVSVIFSKLQGGFRFIMVIWSGRFGRAPVVVLVISKVAPRFHSYLYFMFILSSFALHESRRGNRRQALGSLKAQMHGGSEAERI